ncbi:MAG: calcium-transporting P-type ATPase, PMR1-type [Candidatus Aenigmarchaeota archaeon]|nr:calcium-transporting P-type ATPase, PMR1-type [Candidatus Aenigmarchaeota archaeon]
MMTKEWHKIAADEAFGALESSPKGLSDEEVAKRLVRYGHNEIREKKRTPSWIQFLRQFNNVLVLILIAASAVSAYLGELLDASVIMAIVFLNAILGFIQERRAEKALEALKRMAAPKSEVIRDGKVSEINSRELVPGDLIILKVGDKVPADCRITEALNLKADEAVLTGESLPVPKNTSAMKDGKSVADRKNMLFSGTTIVYGSCKALVVETGMRTEFGKIASLLQQEQEIKTPLQQKLEELGKGLGIIILAICAVVFFAGFLQGRDALEMFLIAVSLAVAAIPEGLPAIVTITLAIGLTKMAKKNAIIRKLPSAETLGSTTVVCSDKTGTLTMSQMTVKKLYADGEVIDVTGEGYDTKGAFMRSGKEIKISETARMLLETGKLCNDAVIGDRVIGDPTEAALLVSASKAGVHDLRDKYRRTGEIPFESERKMMSVVYDISGRTMYTKGAPEEVLKKCVAIMRDGKIDRLTEKDRKEILLANSSFAKNALRVLGFATKKLKPGEKPEESKLIFIGLQAMIDPPRPEVADAIDKCKRAGMKVVMITGDHRETAVAIAKELGMLGSGSLALTGEELDDLDDKKFEDIVEEVTVYARVSPEHKVRITDALKKKGHVVAMTGDGVNDAPALKRSDIGIAMGITGTDVTKEASDMVLTDDNFATIVTAIEEGRTIYDNIRKFVLYLLSCNIGEVIVIFTSILINLPLPLFPIQLLWLNLVTDGLPALALGFEPPEADVMNRPPRNPKDKVLNKRVMFVIIAVGLIMALGTLAMFYIELGRNGEAKARTVAFTTLVMAEMAVALNLRTEKSLLKINPFGNKKMLLAIASSVLLHLMIVYVPFFNAIFDTVPLDAQNWLEILFVMTLIFVVVEIKKYYSHHFYRMMAW